MSVADRMTEYCASLRMAADLTRNYEAFEVFEDMRNLFGHVAEALENESDSTIRPFMEGMARALATASHVAASLNVPAMLDWLDSRGTKGETPGETCVYGDLIRLYTYLSDLCGHKASRMGGQAGRALGAVSDGLAGMLREVGA